MNTLFRILLFLVSCGALFFVFRRIRKSQAQIDNAIFWIILMLAMVAVSIFPGVIIFLSNWLGVESPANFVFLSIIFILLLKVFHLSLDVSKQQYQIQQLTQIIAINKLQEKPDSFQKEGLTDEQHESTETTL